MSFHFRAWARICSRYNFINFLFKMLLWVLASWLFHPKCLHADWADYFGAVCLLIYLFLRWSLLCTSGSSPLLGFPSAEATGINQQTQFTQCISDCTWWLMWTCYARTIPPWVKNTALGSPLWHATSESESLRVRAKTLVSDKVFLVLRPYSADCLGIHNLLTSVSQVIRLQGNFVPMWDRFLN